MTFPHEFDDPDDRQRHRNYAHRIVQREDDGIEAKLVVMGNTGVGKTSLVTRYTENRFTTATTATTGALFVTHKTDFGGFRVKLQIWDTAGQERFRSMAPMYYRGANAAIIMYDITRLESFSDVRIWLEELKKNCNPDLLIYIVGSKADLTSSRKVTPDLARSSLHKWFPPPRKVPSETPPNSAEAGGSGFPSYLRPRFTSLASAYTVNSGSSSGSASKVALARANTTASVQALPRRDGARFHSFQSFEAPPKLGEPGANRKAHRRDRSWGPSASTSALVFPSSIFNAGKETPQEAVSDQEEEEEPEWGLGKYMQLFEVSAKDSSGINSLFNSIMSSVIERREAIVAEKRIRERDSILLHSAYGAVQEEEEPRDKENTQRSWCC